MNKTKIEYADYTWNPITGCKIRCGDFCYAAKIVKRYRLYGGSFVPRFHPNKLEEPAKLKKPSVIFCCDMGDIFSPGAKKVWREKVKTAADAAPWHTYLWLTKNPRYDDSWVRPNWWLGATITGPEDAYKREIIVGENIWYSFEPLFGIIQAEHLYDARQIIIGKATNYNVLWSDQWAWEVTGYYQERAVRVFWKNNILNKGPRELAWNLATKTKEYKK